MKNLLILLAAVFITSNSYANGIEEKEIVSCVLVNAKVTLEGASELNSNYSPAEGELNSVIITIRSPGTVYEDIGAFIPASNHDDDFVPYGFVGTNQRNSKLIMTKDRLFVSDVSGPFQNWGTYDIDLKTGKGEFNFSATGGWHSYRNKVKAQFKNCRKI